MGSAHTIFGQSVHILLDKDGVLGNFCKAAHDAHNREYQPELITQFDMAGLWNISAEEFWKPLTGAYFWEGLEPYPWAEELLKALRAIAPVTICTAPSRDRACCAGKLDWLERELGVKSYEVVFANRKFLLANATNVLVDDSWTKVESFKAAGGRAILFPQPWNQAQGDWTDVIAQVRELAVPSTNGTGEAGV